MASNGRPQRASASHRLSLSFYQLGYIQTQPSETHCWFKARSLNDDTATWMWLEAHPVKLTARYLEQNGSSPLIGPSDCDANLRAKPTSHSFAAVLLDPSFWFSDCLFKIIIMTTHDQTVSSWPPFTLSTTLQLRWLTVSIRLEDKMDRSPARIGRESHSWPFHLPLDLSSLIPPLLSLLPTDIDTQLLYPSMNFPCPRRIYVNSRPHHCYDRHYPAMTWLPLATIIEFMCFNPFLCLVPFRLA